MAPPLAYRTWRGYNGPMERRQVRYMGRVQGVGFRATARALVSSLPVTGWVRNEHDGSVLMEVQGSAAAVEEAIKAVRTRMSGFIRSERVEAVAAVEGEPGFEVRR